MLTKTKQDNLTKIFNNKRFCTGTFVSLKLDHLIYLDRSFNALYK